VHVSSRAIELTWRLLPWLLAMCPKLRRTGVSPVSQSGKRIFKKAKMETGMAELAIRTPDRWMNLE
jgi:hypothetical protein